MSDVPLLDPALLDPPLLDPEDPGTVSRGVGTGDVGARASLAVEIRALDARAHVLLDALEGDLWVDFSRRGSDGGLPQRPGRSAHVAFSDAAPVGLVVIDRSAFGAELTLAVLRDHRRAGLGALLVAHAIAQIGNDAGLLFVDVEAENLIARHFFERLGFVLELAPAAAIDRGTLRYSLVCR